ncbi:MAG: peptidoglycan DD-metalloendopeptidase family protein [Bacteroidales bacterium]|nr:peptidoglycan DD-metalloendopeptidase family protein [Bacteroidales bacterium]
MIDLRRSFVAAFAVIIIASGLASCGGPGGRRGADGEQKDTIYPLGFLTDTLVKVSGTVPAGDNFSSWVSRLGLGASKAYELAGACGESFDVRKLVAGKAYDAYYYAPDSLSRALHYIVYNNSRTTSTIFKCFDSLSVWTAVKPVTIEEKYADITIKSSLWNDMLAAGASPLLILSLSDVYAWTVDFFGLQSGDRFRVLYNQKVCEGEVIAVDTIRYALFSRGDSELPAIMYDLGDGGNVYWNEKGESMRKAFLKAPLHFSRISSGFSYARKHPVTRKVQPHTGVDYAAPAGTPVMSIGDGTVISAGYSGAGGNTVKIRHNSVYTTAYLHLSKYGAGIKAGARVRQGQVIGYVGSTGRPTGPHLDFRVWKNGSPINPLTMQSPPAEPLPASAREAFDSVRVSLDSLLRTYEND